LQRRRKEVTVSWLNTSTTSIQTVFGFILAYAGLAGVTPSEIPAQMHDGYHCLMGTMDAALMKEHPGCVGGNFMAWLAFCVMMFVMNISLLFVVKHGGCATMYAAAACVLPLSNVANTSTLLMGDAAQPFNFYTLCGLPVILSGILLYAVQSESQPPPAPHDKMKAIRQAADGFIEDEEEEDMLFDLETLVAGRGVVGASGVFPWLQISDDVLIDASHNRASFLLRWAVTADTRGDIVSPLLRRRHSAPPSPSFSMINASPHSRVSGIFSPEMGSPKSRQYTPPEIGPDGSRQHEVGGFYEWDLTVEESEKKKRESIIDKNKNDKNKDDKV